MAAPLALALLALAARPASAAHGYALWGELKYPPGFAHFDYVNPHAPKGGELRLASNLRVSTFDKYNPFTIKGNAPAFLAALMFDTLLAGSLDESGSAYGLLAEDVQVAPDRLSATFRLRPQARFHNGDAVLARDVKHSFDTLVGPHAMPGYKTLLIDVAGVDLLDARTVRFRFHKPNRELPLTVGALPVFSHKWGQGKPFDQVVMEPPIGSGPYTIGPVKFGKDITYLRNPHYWARDLNVQRGSFNFDRVLVKIYRDNTARLEAFKAGEFDLMEVFSAGDWARRMTGKGFASGQLRKGEFRHRMPTGFQSYVLNSRRPALRDARVREALGLAIDYEWMNRRLFYGSYTRVRGLFGNTECAASGPPGAAELALMQPLRAHIPLAAFGPAYAPPHTRGPTGADDSSGLRHNLRRARQLLQQAGWTLGADGLLRNAQGQPLALEYLDSSDAGIRTISQWQRNLQKLGVRLHFRTVDFALYQQRLQKFDFDITNVAFQGSVNPGQEFADLFGSQAADTPDSGNMAGVKNPAVDALIARMVGAPDKPAFVAACRTLERVISHSHYLLPQWYSAVHRLAYNDWRLQATAVTPAYFSATNWVIGQWWARAAGAAPAGAAGALAPAAHAAEAPAATRGADAAPAAPAASAAHAAASATPAASTRPAGAAPAASAASATAQAPQTHATQTHAPASAAMPFDHLSRIQPPSPPEGGVAVAADGGSLMLNLSDAQGQRSARFFIWRRLGDQGTPRFNRLADAQGHSLSAAQAQALLPVLRRIRASLPAADQDQAPVLDAFIQRAAEVAQG